MVYCHECSGHNSERKGTALEQSRLPESQACAILQHVRERAGTRSTSRLVGVHRDTVTRYIRIAGEQAQQLHQELLAYSPNTREVQLDEKWSFVGKKEAGCSESEKEEAKVGENWDHTAIDAEHRLLLALVPGKRTAAHCQQIIAEVKQRTGGRSDLLLSSDEHPPYRTAIKKSYAQKHSVPEPAVNEPSTKSAPLLPDQLVYVTVKKERKQGRVIKVYQTLVFGTSMMLALLLNRSTVSSGINTAFVERHNGTDRHQNARKVRKTYGFSKDWDVHNAASYFVGFSYNFCWPVRTLRIKKENGHWQQRTPAMAAGLADHLWTLQEWLTYPAMLVKSI